MNRVLTLCAASILTLTATSVRVAAATPSLGLLSVSGHSATIATSWSFSTSNRTL
jgi:hypothetical protein